MTRTRTSRPIYTVSLAIMLSILAACGTPGPDQRPDLDSALARTPASASTSRPISGPTAEPTQPSTQAADAASATATPTPGVVAGDRCQAYLELEARLGEITQRAVVTTYRCHDTWIDSTGQSPPRSPDVTTEPGAQIAFIGHRPAIEQPPRSIDVRFYPEAGRSASFMRWPEELPTGVEPVDMAQPEPGTHFEYPIPGVVPGEYSLVIRIVWEKDIEIFYALSLALGAMARPRIDSFQVTPAQADPGNTVTLTWKADGKRATLCPSARYVLFTRDECRPVDLSGSMTFTVPANVAGNRTIDFLLTVEGEEGSTPEVWQTSVAMKCATTWFFSDEPQAGVCPRTPIHTAAAMQRFERGTMIWLEQLGRTLILQEAPIVEGDIRKRADVLHDPLQVIREPAATAQPPEGLYAPEGRFGLVWRGDVEGSPGYREALGWALAPEHTYEGLYQCDDARPSGGYSWQTCYLEGPEGEVYTLHPLGGWYLSDERAE